VEVRSLRGQGAVTVVAPQGALTLTGLPQCGQAPLKHR